MAQNYSELPYGACRPMTPRYGGAGKPGLRSLLLLPLRPVLWALREAKRRRNREKSKLHREILQLRNEVAGLRRINLELLRARSGRRSTISGRPSSWPASPMNCGRR